MTWEDYPFEDYPQGHRVERSFSHGPWVGMPPRDVWNSSPNLQNCQVCPSCGYKWGEIDFTYDAGILLHGKPTGPIVQSKCWNCWMIDSKPDYMRKVWDFVDGNGRPAKAPAARLDHL